MAAPYRDYGHAQFSSSAGARNAMAFANPLSPGGMSPKGVHIPTMGWALIFVAVAFLGYHYFIK
jgi:hypothetical protein